MKDLPAVDAHFDRGGWWDPGCRAFASLRAVTTFRLGLLRDWLPAAQRRLVVDLGCGGGLLAVPLAQDGARVVAVDIAGKALRELQARQQPGVAPVRGAIDEAPVADGCADLVLLADVLEHVAPSRIAPTLAEAARVLAVGGHLFVNTIARTQRARWLAIWLAEGLGFVPRGTHRYDHFVAPDELETHATRAGLVRVQRCGERPRLLRSLRHGVIQLERSEDLRVGYAALYRRSAA